MPDLCRKNEKVMSFNWKNGVPDNIVIDNPELLPICLTDLNETEFITQFMNWINARKIPDERDGFKELKERFGEDTFKSINYASLSDQYWIRNRAEKWATINYFTKDYKPDIGNIFFEPWKMDPLNIRNKGKSPDLTTNGLVKKRWIQNKDKTSSLVKAASKDSRQEPLNEVMVSIFLEDLNIIPFVKYKLHIEGIDMCSICDNFVTADTEFIPAAHFYHKQKRPDGVTVYNHLLRMLDAYEIEGAKRFIDGMIFIDCLTANEDRNLNNFGFLRNVNTNKIIGPAPLFDYASAYWNTKQISQKTKSKFFGDIEKHVFDNMLKRCNLEMLQKDKSYENLIATYPGLTELKKENLTKAIRQRNYDLLHNREMERVSNL